MSARICVFSQRNLGRLVSRCGAFEFEDVICQVDEVDLINPGLYYYDELYDYYRLGKKCSNWLARNAYIRGVNPGIRKVRIKNNYELFVAFFQFPSDISSINAIIDWRKKCRVAICWIDDAWVSVLDKYRETYKLLKEFDFILLNYSNSIKPMQSVIGRPCLYLAPGIDMIRFCPFPNPPIRSIDVYSIGRRSPTMHQNLIKLSENREIFYVYDTIVRMEAREPLEHRNLIANIAKRSRYFVVNIPKMDLQSETHGQIEVGFRYYEGAGAGTVMLGEATPSDNFRQDFDWDDVVIHMPNDKKEIMNLINSLNGDTDRTRKIRRNNVVQSLLRHDWVYRWKDVLKHVGMAQSSQLGKRENCLKELAHIAEES